jgi:hypothetical protein
MTAMLSGGCGGNDDDDHHHNHHHPISPSLNFITYLATAQLFEHVYVSRELIGNRTSDLQAHSIVPIPTTLPVIFFQFT